MSSGYDTIIDAIQLHFLIQTDDVPSISFHPETPSVTNCVVEVKDCSSDVFKKITDIRRTAELFQSRCNYLTTSYVSSAYLREVSKLDSFHSRNTGLISRISGSILQHCSLNQFRINQQAVRLPQIIGCFEKCIEAINQASCSTSSSANVQLFNQFQLVKPNCLKLPPSIESSKLTTQQYSFEDEDCEMKDIDDIDDISNFFTNKAVTESQFYKYYKFAFQKYFRDNHEVFFNESNLLKHHRSITNEIEAKIGTIDPMFINDCFNEIRQHNFILKSNIFDQVNQETSFIVEEMCTRAKNGNITFPDSFHDRYQTMYKNLAKGIPMDFHKVLENFISSQSKTVFETISKIYETIATYKDSFREQFSLKLCLTPRQFEDQHVENILAAKLSVNWEDSSIENLNRLLDIVTYEQKKVFHESNSRLYAKEEIISKQAYEYALERFKFYLDEKISSTTLSENQLQKIYHDISAAVLSSFKNVLEYPYNELWLLQHRELKKKLNSLEMTYAQKNRSHLKKIDLVQKESMENGVQCYREEMKRNLPETKLPKESFNHVHTTSFSKSLAKFHEKLNQIDKNIWNNWEDQLKNKLYELEKRFAEDNNKKQIQSTLHSDAVKLQEEHIELEEHHLKVCTQRSEGHNRKQYGIGLYIDSQQVCVGVYVNHDVEFSDNVQNYEPLIRFGGGEVYLGEEALSSCRQNLYPCYNIFELLCFNYDNLPYDAKISDKRYQLDREEILALYFHRIRRNTERMIETRISSCCVAVTGLLTSGSKQLLKASLQLAGFQTNMLIPCTTAMAISYSLKFRNGDLSSGRKHDTLLVYTSDKTVEIAVAEISEAKISTHNLWGDLNVYNRVSFYSFFWTVEKTIRRLVKKNNTLSYRKL